MSSRLTKHYSTPSQLCVPESTSLIYLYLDKQEGGSLEAVCKEPLNAIEQPHGTVDPVLGDVGPHLLHPLLHHGDHLPLGLEAPALPHQVLGRHLKVLTVQPA